MTGEITAWDSQTIRPALGRVGHHTVYRLLPARYLVSDRLADSEGDRQRVRQAIEASRAVRSPSRARALAGYDDALAFAFKYPHLQTGGRFSHPRHTNGVLYASFAERAALAERAYQQIRLLREQGRGLRVSMVPTSRIAFGVDLAAAVDTRRSPFGPDSAWRDPLNDHSATQQFAGASLDAGADSIVYTSVRDPDLGANVAALTPAVLTRRTLDARRVRDWFLSATEDRVIMQTTRGALERFVFDPAGRPVSNGTR